ncbi:MAG TPA: glycosyltransferase [Vicinamibacterales bacterium]|nr:glycosyltransferase [Vicinamibacterales bacterium]
MNRRPPSVSVVVPAFNAAGSIGEAVASVLAQTYDDYEIVVVDDGSTDGTADLVRRAAPESRIVRQPNGGPGRARNAGIRASTANLIAFLDADDTWLPHKLEAQVAYFRSYPQTGLLHTDWIGSENAMAGQAALYAQPGPPRHVFCELFHTDYEIATLSVMVRRDVLETVGLFDERREVHVEDWDLWLRIAARYPVGYLPQPAAVRLTGGIMSADVEKTFRGQAEAIRKNVALCRVGCPYHRAQPADCLRRRWYRLHWELGYSRLQQGRASAARASFLQAIRWRPWSTAAWAQLAASFASERTREAVRQGMKALGQQRALRQPGGHGGPTISLVDDTLYRRSRRSLARAVHTVDRAIHRARSGERQRILFEAASPMSFVIFSPVYQRLQRDPRLEFWFTVGGRTWEADRLYAAFGVTGGVVRADRVRWTKFDLVINTDFWDSTWVRRQTRRLHLFHGVAGKYNLDSPVDIAPTVRSYDRLLFPNEDRLRRYVEAGLVGPGSPVGVLVGYPKLDALVNGAIDGAAVLQRLGIEPGRPTVLYAPTWSPSSSLNLMGMDLVRALEAAGYNVIVKLHDRSLDPSDRGSGGIDWRAQFEPFRNDARVRLVTDPDATPLLAAADAMITDHSSIGFEYTPLDRPIVVIDCPQLLMRAQIAPSKVAELRRAAEVVSDVPGAVEAVARQLADPGMHRSERQDIARRFFYRPGTATERAVAAVYDLLELDTPPVSRDAPIPVAQAAPARPARSPHGNARIAVESEGRRVAGAGGIRA